MRSLKCVLSICAQNFRKWQTDYRIYCIAFLLCAMVGIYADDMRKVADYLGAPMPLWIFPFLYSQFYTKLIFLMPVVLLFCNAPFTDRNQTFVFMRSGRTKWLCGQVLYIIAASLAYFVFLFLLSLIFTMIGGNFTAEWGETLMAIGTDPLLVMGEVDAPFLMVSKFVLAHFTPLQAVWFTLLLSWLGGVFIGLTVFASNLLSGTRSLGIIISSVFVVVSCAIENEPGWKRLLSFSPISWTTLDRIDVGGLTKNPDFYYCVTVYAVLILLLAAAILIFGRKKSLDIKQ